MVWEWFTRARAKNIPMTGRLIQERAIMYASKLGIDQFSGSNGWLEKWQKRHNVRMVVLSGEVACSNGSLIWRSCRGRFDCCE